MKYVKTTITHLIRISLILLLTLIWTRDLIKNSYVYITLSITLSIAIEFIITKITNKRTSNKNITKNDLKQIENIKLQLPFYSNEKAVLLLVELYGQTYEVIKKNDYITTKGDTTKLIYPAFSSQFLSITDLSKIYKLSNELSINDIIIHCIDCEENVSNLTQQISNKNITIINVENMYYNIIKKLNIKVENEVKLVDNKMKSWKDFSNIVFNKKLTKNYILSGFLLLFASFFTKYTLIYEICGSLLIVLSLFSMFRKSSKKSS